DLLGEVAVGDRGGDIGDVANLVGELAGHQVDVVGEVLPGPTHALHLGLTAELAFRADLACDARDLGSEGVELIDHRVDRVLDLEELALAFHSDLSREVSVGDRSRHLGDVADLAPPGAGHVVDVVGEALPYAGDTRNLCLAAQLALRADLARHARHLGAERTQLVDHRVHDPRRFQELSLEAAAIDVGRHRLREVAFGDGVDDAGHVAVRADDVFDQVVDRVEGRGPGTAGVADRPVLDLAFLADVLAEPAELALEALVGLDDVIDGDRDLAR